MKRRSQRKDGKDHRAIARNPKRGRHLNVEIDSSSFQIESKDACEDSLEKESYHNQPVKRRKAMWVISGYMKPQVV